MASETQLAETSMLPRKRTRQNKSTKGKKRAKKAFPGTGTKVKIDNKMKKLFRKRAREYNSDDDEDEPTAVDEIEVNASARPSGYEEVANGNSSGDEEERVQESEEEEEDGILGYEGNAVQPGITRFAEGCRAFKMAFTKIIKHNVLDDTFGPVLSAHKKLVVEKLAEEVAERKVKGEAKKEKQMVGEKGHVKPANFLDSHEKFLISVATKGVVKLFNAVNKAQNAQKGLNPSRFKDAKELDKRRKRAFLLELRKKSSQAADNPAKDDDGPGWAPLRDSYMLTSSKLKNWDKMQDTNAADDMDGTISHDSSDED